MLARTASNPNACPIAASNPSTRTKKLAEDAGSIAPAMTLYSKLLKYIHPYRRHQMRGQSAAISVRLQARSALLQVAGFCTYVNAGCLVFSLMAFWMMVSLSSSSIKECGRTASSSLSSACCTHQWHIFQSSALTFEVLVLGLQHHASSRYDDICNYCLPLLHCLADPPVDAKYWSGWPTLIQ